MKKLLAFGFGLAVSTAVFADFSGQTITVEYVTATEPGEDPLTVAAQPGTTPSSLVVPGSSAFNFDSNVNCTIAITATQITIGSCDFATFGSAGGITFNGFRFTQDAAAPDITGVTPTGSVTGIPLFSADTIAVNLIGQTLAVGAGTAVVDATFFQQPGAGATVTGVPTLSPLALVATAGLLAAVGAGMRRKKKK